MKLLLVAVIVLWALGLRLIQLYIKKLKDENTELRKSIEAMLEANYKLTIKYKINQAKSHNPNNYGKF